MSFHPANVAATGYAPWRVKLLARIAVLLGVQFHIEGLPFGGEARRQPCDVGEGYGGAPREKWGT